MHGLLNSNDRTSTFRDIAERLFSISFANSVLPKINEHRSSAKKDPSSNFSVSVASLHAQLAPGLLPFLSYDYSLSHSLLY